MKNLVVFFLISFFFSFNIKAQTRVEIKALVKVDLPEENKKAMFACDSCYVIFKEFSHEGSAEIIEEFYPLKILERMQNIPEGYELFFQIDQKKQFGIVQIVKKEKIPTIFSWHDNIPLTVWVSPRY